MGFSNKPERPSFKVATYLAENGYRVIPVNPGLAGQDFMGETIVADLASIPKDAGVDMVDIFRRPDFVPPIVETALEELPDLKTVWLQLGVISEDAEALATGAGKAFVQDRCPKIERPRLIG